MAPADIKGQVEQAYSQAGKSSTSYRPHDPQIEHLLREIKLYGREAGADFADTHLGRIVEDARQMARRRHKLLTIHAYEAGRAAICGFAETLRERTDLKVEVEKSAITLAWSDDGTGGV